MTCRTRGAENLRPRSSPASPALHPWHWVRRSACVALLLAAAPLAHAQQQRADISLSMSVSNVSPGVGTQVTFAVTATNAGPRPTNSVTIRDRLPSGFTLSSAQVTRGTYKASTGEWKLGLPVATSGVLTLIGTVNPSGSYTNVAEVVASSVPDPDSVPNNGNPAEDDYAALSITPNVRPVITGQVPLSTLEDTALTISLLNLTVNDPDNPYPTGFTLQLQAGTNYTVSGTTIMPSGNFSGALSVPVTVNDGTDDSAPFSLLVTVASVNDRPVITGQDPLATPEETPLTITPDDLTISDPDDSVFTLILLPDTSYVITGPDEITPEPGITGAITVSVQVSDGEDVSDPYDLLVTVEAVPNVPPVITDQVELGTLEDTSLTITLEDLVVSDPDNDYPDDFVLTTLAGSDYTLTGVNRITPSSEFSGSLAVPVVVNDGTDDSAPFNLLVTVTSVNDVPAIVGHVALETPEQMPLTVTLDDVQVNDPDNVYPDDFTLHVLPGADYTLTGPNEITPDSGFAGELAVHVSVNDGTDESPRFDLAVNVRSVDAAPEITGQVPLSTPQATPLTIELDDLIVNDLDNVYPDDFTLALQPGTGYTVTDVDELTPDAEFRGQLTVSVVVNDGTVDSAPFALDVTVFVPLPAIGCPRSHCSPGNGGWSGLPPPAAPAQVVWQRSDGAGESHGSNIGLGCSADGTIAVCTYNGPSDNVVAYDFDGNRLWTSGPTLDLTTYTSVPLILTDGDTIISDDRNVVRYDRSGNLRWITPLPEGGAPISPVMTSDGVIVLATAGGPIYAVDFDGGELLAQLFVRESPADTGFFSTRKTPAVRGNRVYVSSEHHIGNNLDPRNLAWLVALEIDRHAPDPDDRIKVVWHYEFGARSLSSPMVMDDIILFDGERPGPDVPFDPYLFAVRDTGPAPEEVWKEKPVTQAKAAFTPDPRPGMGFWYLQRNSSLVTRRRETDGSLQEVIDLGKLTSSAMTFTGTTTHPVMILSAASGGHGYVVALDVVTASVTWQVDLGIGSDNIAPGQFPLLTDGTRSRVVFTTNTGGGARAIGTVP